MLIFKGFQLANLAFSQKIQHFPIIFMVGWPFATVNGILVRQNPYTTVDSYLVITSGGTSNRVGVTKL